MFSEEIHYACISQVPNDGMQIASKMMAISIHPVTQETVGMFASIQYLIEKYFPGDIADDDQQKNSCRKYSWTVLRIVMPHPLQPGTLQRVDLTIGF